LPQRPEEEIEMTYWYTAHLIMFVKFKKGSQPHYPVWENIVLVEARTEDEAFAKAEGLGRSEEGDDGGSFRWGGEPAEWVFAGVRKLTECQAPDGRPGDGAELSYNELALGSLEAVKKLAAGERVQVTYNDRYRPARRKPSKGEGETKTPRRRGA
jgi:hypothetical protein